MTPSDADLDIDPALDAHLRRTLREVAATVGAGEASDPTVVRLVPTTPPGRPRHWRWIAAAAVTGLASGAALMAVATRNDQPGSDTSDATAAVGPDLDKLGAECIDATNRVGTMYSIPEPVGGSETESAQAMSMLFVTGFDHDRLLVSASDVVYSCRVGVPGFSVVSDQGAPVSLLAGAPDGDDVVIDWRSGYGALGPDGPSVEFFGRVGPDVTEVSIELDGSGIVAGTVHDGWFVIERPTSEDFTTGEPRLNWTNTEGVAQSAPVGLLDAPDPVELCAADADCVRSQLMQLREAARSLESPTQYDSLADLVITDEERMATTQAFAECVNAGPYDIVVVPLPDGAISTSGDDLSMDSPNWTAQNQLQESCRAEHMDLVDQAWSLLDATDRIAEG